MKRGIIFFILVLIILLPFSSAYLTVLEIRKVNINKDTVQTLVETNKDTYLLFIFKSKDSTILKNIYSNTLQEAYTSKYYSFNLDTSNLYKIELVSYSYVNNKIQLDTLTATSYILTGKEKSTEPVKEQIQIEQVQTQVQETLPSKTSYIYSNNQLVAKKVNNQINYYHSDQISSTSIITDSSSNIVYKSDYLPFGSGFNIQGKEQYTYTGKELDTSGLYYYGARYYDSSTGRFTQVDPIQDYSSSSYIYVDNNPLIYIDPSGNEKIKFTKEQVKNLYQQNPGLTAYYGDFKRNKAHKIREASKSYLTSIFMGSKRKFEYREFDFASIFPNEDSDTLKEEFGKFVESEIESLDPSFRATCAGFAFYLLVEFAKEKDLDIKLTLLKGSSKFLPKDTIKIKLTPEPKSLNEIIVLDPNKISNPAFKISPLGSTLNIGLNSNPLQTSGEIKSGTFAFIPWTTRKLGHMNVFVNPKPEDIETHFIEQPSESTRY